MLKFVNLFYRQDMAGSVCSLMTVDLMVVGLLVMESLKTAVLKNRGHQMEGEEQMLSYILSL